MLCPNCHVTIEPDMRFCPNCGYRLRPVPSSNHYQEVTPTKESLHYYPESFYQEKNTEFPSTKNPAFNNFQKNQYPEFPTSNNDSVPFFPDHPPGVQASPRSYGKVQDFQYPPFPKNYYSYPHKNTTHDTTAHLEEQPPIQTKEQYGHKEIPIQEPEPDYYTYSSPIPQPYDYEKIFDEVSTEKIVSTNSFIQNKHMKSSNSSLNIPKKKSQTEYAQDIFEQSIELPEEKSFGIGSSSKKTYKRSILLPPEDDIDDDDDIYDDDDNYDYDDDNYIYEKSKHSHKGLWFLLILIILIGSITVLQLIGTIHIQSWPIISSFFNNSNSTTASSSEISSITESDSVTSILPAAMNASVENEDWTLGVNSAEILSVIGEQPAPEGYEYLKINLTFQYHPTVSDSLIRYSNYDYTLGSIENTSAVPLETENFSEQAGSLGVLTVNSSDTVTGDIYFKVPKDSANTSNYILYFKPRGSSSPKASFNISITPAPIEELSSNSEK